MKFLIQCLAFILVLVSLKVTCEELLDEEALQSVADVIVVGTVQRLNNTVISESGEIITSRSNGISSGRMDIVYDMHIKIETVVKGPQDMSDEYFSFRHMLRGGKSEGQMTTVTIGHKVRLFARTTTESSRFPYSSSLYTILEPNGIVILQKGPPRSTKVITKAERGRLNPAPRYQDQLGGILKPLTKDKRFDSAKIVAVGTIVNMNSTLTKLDGSLMFGDGAPETSNWMGKVDGGANVIYDALIDVEKFEKGYEENLSLAVGASYLSVSYRHIIMPRGMSGPSGQNTGVGIGQKVRIFAVEPGVESVTRYASSVYTLIEPNGVEMVETPVTAMIVKRKVTPFECPWLEKPVDAGTIVYPYAAASNADKQPVKSRGVAVAFSNDGEADFFELPRDSVVKAPKIRD